MTEKWMPGLLVWFNGGRDSEVEDEALNVYFDENGFGSKLFMNNIGSAIVYFFIYLLIFAFTGLLKLMSKFSIMYTQSTNSL
jgi:hypothetical protein